MTGADDYRFFKQATLRICGSLDIERALASSYQYVRQFIPAQAMHLYIYDPVVESLRSVAVADQAGGRVEEVVTHLNQAARERLQGGDLPHVLVMESMSDHPIGRPVAQSLGIGRAAGLAMVLRLEQQDLGALVLHTTDQVQYSDRHVRLLASLNEPFAVALSNSLRFREVNLLSARLADDNRYLHEEMRKHAGDQIIGGDFGLKGVMDLVREVAPLASPVLLLGQTGTGKEVIAGAIHNLSPRRDKPFIKVNCGAIPPTLIDSELFGHEKGAFTGALRRKRGLFERAHGGTIFLDEIGELPAQAQVRLLRVLQEKVIERVGGSESIELDLRIISATHRDLETMVADGSFRQDLYYRLRVFPIRIPPLKERKRDIPILVQHFMQKKAREIGYDGMPSLYTGAVDQLMAYDWPGNVRELENAVERALILSKGAPLTFDGLRSGSAEPPSPMAASVASGDELNLDAVVAAHIQRVLVMTKGRVEGEKGAARILGLHPSTLRHRMRRLGVPFGRAVVTR